MNEHVKRFFAYIKQEEISQRDAARMLGISRNTITNWRNGGSIEQKSVDKIEKLLEGWEPAELSQSVPSDPALAVIMKNWAALSPDDKITLASIVRDLASGDCTNRRVYIPRKDLPKHLPETLTEESKPIFICPRCKTVFPCDYEHDRYVCPNCGQHMRFK